MNEPAAHSRESVSAVAPFLLALLAVFIASGLDAAVKGAALAYPLLSIVFWRYLCGSLMLLPLYAYRSTTPLSGHNLTLHAARGAAQTLTAVTYFYALTKIGLAEATVIGFTAALWVVPMSALILREPVRWPSVLAIVIGFVGAVIAVSGRPLDFSLADERWIGVVSAIFSALMYALTLVLMRLQTRSDDALSILTFSNVVPALILCPFVLVVDRWPGASIVPVTAALAVFGVLVWWLLTLAYARVEAQQLAPIDYTALVWAAVFGFVFFSEVPTWQLYVGASLIVTGCLTVVYRRRRSAVSVESERSWSG